MKNFLASKYYYLIFLVLTLSSCKAIASIFKAGVWVGILIVIVVVGLILWLVGKARK